MNKRIQELAVAAAPANSSIPHSEWNIPKEFIEKFAQLIVSECIHLCDQVDIVGADECIDNIKEHFEVK